MKNLQINITTWRKSCHFDYYICRLIAIKFTTMIIDAKSIAATLLIVAIAFVYGLKLIRKFALQIAQENHDAVTAMEQEEEQQRLKKEKAADAAADAAYAHVKPMLNVSSNVQSKVGEGNPTETSSDKFADV